jgi:hypothetical protein
MMREKVLLAAESALASAVRLHFYQVTLENESFGEMGSGTLNPAVLS